jgi:anti-sigma-K factor RskA
MSDMTDHGALPEDELLAAEFVLGVLQGSDRAAAQRLLERDRNFARMVADWERRLAPWAVEIDEVAAPPRIWDAIAVQLPAQGAARGSLWESLAFWRVFALASALAAACLGVFIYLGAVSQEPPLVATIEGGGARVFVATIDTKRGTVAIVPASFTADATRVPELWLIPADGRPRPVGLLRADQTVTLTLTGELAGLAKGNATLAVSLEPPGGSPTGAPTGPVIGAGKLTSL